MPGFIEVLVLCHIVLVLLIREFRNVPKKKRQVNYIKSLFLSIDEAETLAGVYLEGICITSSCGMVSQL